METRTPDEFSILAQVPARWAGNSRALPEHSLLGGTAYDDFVERSASPSAPNPEDAFPMRAHSTHHHIGHRGERHDECFSQRHRNPR